ncbi:MAG: histidine kinase [bacterium]|nr:histidine kinase [bacterium]
MRYWALFILLLLINQGYSQSGTYRQYTTKDGLPSDMVYCAIQDEDGFMWFGTDAGLSRFDGYEFVNYSLQDGLPDHEIINFFKDSKGRIWLYTINGTAGYLLKSKIYNSGNAPFLRNLSIESQFTNIFEKESKIYFSGSENLLVLDEDNKIQKIELPTDISYSYALPFRDSILVFTHYNLNWLKDDQLTRASEWTGSSFSSLKQNMVPLPYHHIIDGDRIIFSMISQEFICSYDVTQKNFEFINNNLAIYNLHDVGETLVFTENGVYNVNEEGNRISEIKYPISESSNLLIDKNDDIWITSITSGVYHFDQNPIKQVPNIPFANQLQAVGRNLYCQTGLRDILVLDSEHDAISHHAINVGNIKDLSEYNGEPLILTSHALFYGAKKIPGTYARSISQVDSLLLIVAGSVLYQLDGSFLDKTPQPFTNSSNRLFQEHNSKFRKAHVIKRDSIYLTSDAGLKYFNGTKTEKLHDGIPLTRIRMDDIVSFNGNIAIATSGNGVVIMSKDSICNIGTDDGLSSNIVSCLFSEDSILWVGTKLGLDKVYWKDGSFSILKINQEDGLTPGQVLDIEPYAGNLYVSTSEGLSYFPNNTSFREDNNIPIIINSILADNKLVPEQKQYIFSPRIDDFQINYSAIIYGEKGSLEFRHQLKNVGDNLNNWRITKSRQAYYSNQKSGEYLFQLQVRTKNSEWSDIKEFRITILTPYWKTWWFQVVVTVLLFSVILYSINRFRRARDLRERLDRDRIEAEIKALKAQINPHFLFNALSSIQRFIIKDQKGEAEDYLADYGQLIRKVLDHSDQLTVPLQEEIEILKLYVEIEQLRTGNQFSANFNVEPNLDPYITNVPCMIVQPLIENAIWHGIHDLPQDGVINVNVTSSNGQIIVTVQDNGVGFKSENSTPDRKSYGSKLVKDRLQLLNRFYNRPFEFEISSKPGIGTTATITFPADL